MRWLLALLFILLLPLPGHTAFQFLDTGARPVAMGGAFCAVADDAHGPHYNPAGMAWIHGRKAAISYCQFFRLADLALHEVSFVQPTSWGVLGLAARRFGGDLYREMSVDLSFAHPLSEGVSVGISMRGLQLAISGYGSDETLSLDLGLLAAMTSRLRWGLSVRNLNNGSLGRGKEEMPQVLMVGFAFRPHSRLLLSADLLEDISDCSLEKLAGAYPIELRLGQESSLWDPLTIRLGLQSSPTRFSVGLGLRAGPFHLNYAYRSHQFLDGTHYVSLTSP